MRRQFPCSKCGFAYASTWRSLNASTPVICNACRSKGGKSKVVIDPNPPNQAVNEGANNVNQSTNSSSDQISPFSSVMHQNVAVSIGQIGMIFGNLPFEPTLAFPLIVNGKSQEPTVKSEVHTADDNCETGDFYCGRSSTTSVLEDTGIQIKQEYDCDEAISEAGNDKPIWDNNKVQKKKRSKLPQYTLSPLARFINQLQHVSCYGRRPYGKSKAADKEEPPKYDDVLIYEKCKYVAENEVGLGAKLLLSPPVTLTKPIVVIKEETSSTNESGDYSNCLIRSGASYH